MDALMALDEDDEIDTPSPVAARKKEPEIDRAQADTSNLGTEEVVFDHINEEPVITTETEQIADAAEKQEEAPVLAAESAPVMEAPASAVEPKAVTSVPEVEPAGPSANNVVLAETATVPPAVSAPMPASEPAPTPAPAPVPVPPTEPQTETTPAVAIADPSEPAAPTSTAPTESANISAEDALAELGVALADDFDFDFDDDDDELEDLEAFLSKNT
jgi:hypothetical protein